MLGFYRVVRRLPTSPVKAEAMNLPPILRVPESERLKCAIVLSPFAIFFLAVGFVCGMDYLRETHFRAPGWLIPVTTLAAIHFTASCLVYLAIWHRCRSHLTIQGYALLYTFIATLLLLFGFIALILGSH